MSVILSAIVVLSLILLISEALREEVRQRLENESRQQAKEPPLSFTDGNLWLIQQPESASKAKENVTSSFTNAEALSRCPACGAIITANDERCPSCEISFVTDEISLITDGLQRWTPGTVGPADGIYLPLTHVRE